MKKVFKVLIVSIICVGTLARPLYALTEEGQSELRDNSDVAAQEGEAEEKTQLVEDTQQEEGTKQSSNKEEDQLSKLANKQSQIVSDESELVVALDTAANGSEIVIQGGTKIQLHSALVLDTERLNEISFVSSNDQEVILLNAPDSRHFKIAGSKDSNMRFQDVSLSGSQSSVGGGMIYTGSANHVVNGLSAYGNTLKSSAWYDGFINISMTGGSFTLENSRFENNSVKGWSDGKNLSVIMMDNTGSETYFDNVVFENNETMNQGGAPISAFLNRAKFNLNEIRMSSGNSKGNTAGIYVQEKGNSSVNISNSVFDGNQMLSGMGGALHLNLQGTSNANISNSSFTGNYGDRGAGAINVVLESNNEFRVTESKFINNKGSMLQYNPDTGEQSGLPSTGGALSISQSRGEGNVIIENSKFELNEATDGGALYLSNDNFGKTNVLVSQSIIHQNIADYKGGGIKFNYTLDEDLDHIYKIVDTQITNNTVTGKDSGPGYNVGGFGGGIYIDDLAKYPNLLLLDTVTFNDNKSVESIYWNADTDSQDPVSKSYSRNVINTTPSSSNVDFLRSRGSVYNSDDVYYDYSAFVYYEFPSDIKVENYDGDVYVKTILGTPALEPVQPIAQGYDFVGWFGEDGEKWDFNKDVSEGVHNTLSAKFEKKTTYSLVFESNGGSLVGSIHNIESGSLVSEPVQPTKEGYTFDGWYQDEMFHLAWNFDTDQVSANVTLYAKWIQVETTTDPKNPDVSEGGTFVEEVQTGVSSTSLMYAITAVVISSVALLYVVKKKIDLNE